MLPAEATTGSPAARAALGRAVLGLLGHRADTARHLGEALAADPDLVPARVIEGFASRLLARRDLLPAARAALGAAERALVARGGTRSEALLVRALRASCDGNPQAAVAALESILERDPEHLLAVKLSQAVQFIIGASAGMRASIERVLPAYRPGAPGRGYVLGCHAFALIETGEVARGERAGREAVEAEPLDAWGFHAVMHSLLMQDRHDEGLAWAATRADRYAGCNNFAGHIAWHEALFAVALGRHDRALELHDAEIAVYPSRDYRDVANAVALLFRLEREGVDVGDRWEAAAAAAEERLGDHGSAFADAHYALALTGAGRIASARLHVHSMRARARAGDTFEDRVLGDVGVPVAEAIVALASGSPGHALDALLGAGPALGTLGGSQAQRALFERMTVEAAIEAGRLATTRQLLAAHLRQRPRDPWALDRLARVERVLAAAT